VCPVVPRPRWVGLVISLSRAGVGLRSDWRGLTVVPYPWHSNVPALDQCLRVSMLAGDLIDKLRRELIIVVILICFRSWPFYLPLIILPNGHGHMAIICLIVQHAGPLGALDHVS